MTELFGKLSRALVDCEVCYITVLNRQLEIVWVNQTMVRDYGELAKLKGRKCYEALAGDAKPHSGCAVQTAIRTGCLERAVERIDGRAHLILAIPFDDDLIAELILEIPEKEHTL